LPRSWPSQSWASAVHRAAAGYFERAVEITRKHGGLFIADEVQTAWGRTGDKWFGIENWNVEPDILTSAKGLATAYR